MRKNQAPSSKIQGSSKQQAPISAHACFRILGFGVGSFSGSWFLVLGSFVAFVLAFLPVCTHAQTNNTPVGNRYLLILETSRSMERRGDGTLRAIQQLLLTGIGGQLRYGDTLGIWTYNNKLDAGRFPLQHWSPENHRSTVQNALVFLQSQTCEKQGNLNVVLPALQQVVKRSPFVTIILVSDGEQKINGTPFDEQINKLYELWRTEQQKSKMPIFTILRARAGSFTDFSVNAAPWPVEMPPLPKDLDVAEIKKTPPPSPAPKPPPPRGPNLILSGKKAETPEKKIGAMTTNVPAPALASQPVPSPVKGQENAITLPLSSVPSQPLASQPVVPIASTQLAPSPSVSVAQPEILKPLPPPATRADPIATVPQPLVQATPTKREPEPTPTKTNPDSERLLAPASPAATVQNASAQRAEAVTKTDLPSQPGLQNSDSSTSSPAPIVAVVPRSFINRKSTLAVAGSIIVVAGALLLLWARRTRAARHVSLITRSLDQKKP